jgi:hypothetical protein
LPISLLILSGTSGEGLYSMLRIFVMIAFPASVFASPLSVVSLFSHEKLSKRIFSLAVNLLPAGLIGYALMIEIMEDFFGKAP